MNTQIKIVTNDNNTRAEIAELIPGCSEGMIYDALSYEGITTGINHDAIAASVKQVNDAGEALHYVCIAAIDHTFYSIQYGTNGPVIQGDEINTMQKELATIGRSITIHDYSTRLRNGIFVRANDIIFTIRTSESFTNIFGNKIQISDKPAPLAKERCIAMKSTPGGYQLVAMVTGYVIVNDKNAFDICDPFLASKDKLVLYAHIVPLIFGKDKLIEKITKSASNPSKGESIQPASFFNEIEEKDHLYRIELRRGKKPFPGRPGSIKFLVSLDDIPKYRDDKKIDYKEISCFKEIRPGTILAERVPFKQSCPGINVFGELIETKKVKDIIFSYGNGVIEEQHNDRIRYIAKEHGVLEMNNNYLNVVPELIIHGDVGNSTGNIRYSGSVVVKDTVLNGFKIECGNLTVQGSIEDSVEVNCKGDLIVKKGIIGERTRVTVAGNANVGIVQGATLRVQGDLVIEEFAYHSNIFSGKCLTVNGKGLHSSEKGCVIGGTLSSLDSMDLHSAGSSATLTTLCCGFDPEGYRVLMDTITLEKTLKKKIMQLQNSLHFNPANKAVMLQRVQLYAPEKRAALKSTLQELRRTIAEVDKVAASVALLSRKIFSPDIAQSSIRIHNSIFSPSLIEFPKVKRKIYRESYNVKLMLVDGEIELMENCLD